MDEFIHDAMMRQAHSNMGSTEPARSSCRDGATVGLS
eukprot:COSAG03_NODE_18542_length_353_cov_0.610236_1_plen_36_part_01